MPVYQRQVAQALLQIKAVEFSPQKPVTFKSGILSPVYVDNRRLPFHPAQWRIVIEGFQQLIDEKQPEFDIIAGIAVGGVPHSAALAYVMQKPSIFIRQEAKEHGEKKRIEGGEVTGKRVLLVEDMVTTGSSSLAGVNSLRSGNAIVTDALAIVSYGFDEAQQAFAAARVNLHTLTNFSVLLQEALAMSRFTQPELAVIEDWFNDPRGWAKRQGFE